MVMAIISVSVQYNVGFLPDVIIIIILLRNVTRLLNAMKKFVFLQPTYVPTY